jgi:hypothetical protein
VISVPHRYSGVVAVAIVSVYVVSVGAAIAASVARGSWAREGADTISLLVALTAFVVVGAIIVARRPWHRIGLAFSGLGLITGLGVLAEEYAAYGYTSGRPSLPGAVVAVWVANWYWYPLIGTVLMIIPFLYPTGDVPSPGWRWAFRLGCATLALITLVAWFDPVIEAEQISVPNPIGIAAIEDAENGPFSGPIWLLFTGFVLVAGASVVVRFRRSRGDERQQLKWFTAAAVALVLFTARDFIPGTLVPDTIDRGLDLLFGVCVGLLPVSAGIAILKYRLYDIDQIVNRAVVYVTVSVVLAAVYAFGVVLIPGVFGMADEQPPLVVAALTLTVAALFRPLRARVQHIVDRRFYRSRYDTARTLASFGDLVRRETDLEALNAELLAAVATTMQPAAATLWIRSADEGK